MAEIIVTTRSGEVHIVEALPGLTIMEAIRDAGIDELLALCGGCCSCATCHIYVHEDDITGWRSTTDDENDLLEGSDHRIETSRLSCQLPVPEGNRSVRVTIAPED